MKLLTVEYQGQATAAVLRSDDTVVLLDRAMRDVLKDAPATYPALQRQVESNPGTRVALSEVTVLAPVPDPRKVYCLAGNYADHILEGGGSMSVPKTTPDVFIKPVTAVCGPNSPITLAKIARKIDWELELAIVIGKEGKYIAAANASEHIAGFMAFNDVSERDLVIWDEGVEREESPRRSFFRWLNGKWMDGSAITGPWLVTPDEAGDAGALAMRLDLNDETMQQGNTGQMLLKVEQIVEFVSNLSRLEPGDIIATGTPAGVGAARNRYLQPGDEIRAEIERLGEQRNLVIDEPPSP